jgi:hypothetical protein
MTSAAAIMTGVLYIASSSCSRNRTSFAFPDDGSFRPRWEKHDPKPCHAEGLIKFAQKLTEGGSPPDLRTATKLRSTKHGKGAAISEAM